ncbi:hypothetical protein FIBSPDRAFT_157523 [Athelia psychrophila]|uniref:Uncharacterized protein n=1 Tax=Athelia psychrophila TaxID=1759441 RepID=A0A166BAA5_9AGAM|nr:hypothetical protein FIBSPDRAFT_157523 [Fibularhizoctonia sp. CBS 109695]
MSLDHSGRTDSKAKYTNGSRQPHLGSLEECCGGCGHVPRGQAAFVCWASAGFGITHRGKGYRIAAEDSSRNSGDMMRNRGSRSRGKANCEYIWVARGHSELCEMAPFHGARCSPIYLATPRR